MISLLETESGAYGTSSLQTSQPSYLSGLSAPSITSLLRFTTMGSSPRVRKAAFGLASAQLQRATSGIPGSHLNEAIIWLWMLPPAPFSSETHSISEVTPNLAAAPPPWTEAVVNFLANTTVQMTRRPHEVFELVQSLMPLEPPAAHGQVSISLLAISALRSCLKVLSSPRVSPAEKAAISTYLAGDCLRWA